MKNLIENAIIQLVLTLWHSLHLHTKLGLKMSQISYQNGHHFTKMFTKSFEWSPLKYVHTKNLRSLDMTLENNGIKSRTILLYLNRCHRDH